MGRHPAHLADQRDRETRQRIVAAALDQISEGGYGSASVAGVAGRAGVATGTVYRHFASKGELFAETFRDAAGSEQHLIAELIASDGAPVRERLARAVEAFARRALAAPTLAYALMAEPVDPAVEAARLESKEGYRDLFADLLREGVARQEFQPLDAPVIAAALVGALQESLLGPLAARDAPETLIVSLVGFAVAATGAGAHTYEESHGHH